MAYDKQTQPLPHTKEEVGHKCGICRLEIREEFIDHDMPLEYVCSEFCASVRNKDLEEFRTASPGTFCVYPCPGCGTPMEDVWTDNREDTQCSPCAENARTEARVAALKKCRALLDGPGFQISVWDALRAEVDAAIEGRQC